MSHFLLDTIAGPRILLPSDDAHHATRVLRLREGDAVSGTDGQGGLVIGRLVFDPGPAIEVEQRTSVPRKQPELSVAFALTKQSKPELVVEKLTELGVDRIVGWSAERSVVRWDRDKREQASERFAKVAEAALKQSRRVWLPETPPPTDLEGVCELPGTKIVFDIGAPPLGEASGPSVVVIGPEGGFTQEELARLDRAGAVRVGLAGGVLRAETAAIAAATLVADRLGRWMPGTQGAEPPTLAADHE
ncbi:MAG: RsmE family RNA methyltransferase [Actinomycetota bacterium]